MADSKNHTPRKPRLGRGLSSLIVNSAQAQAAEAPPAKESSGDAGQDYIPEPSVEIRVAPEEGKVAIATGTPLEVGLEQIAANPYQPRREFAEEQLAELAASISQQGVLQPLVVCRAADEKAERPYVLIAGERRLRAARRVGLATVPCVVRSATPQEMLEWALVENIQRADLGPMERAKAYQEYMDRFVLTQAEAAERLGQARATVANYVRMLDLCDEAQGMLSDGMITFGHGKALASLIGRPEQQLDLAKRIVAEGLSVRQAEQIAADIAAGNGERQTTKPQADKRVKAAYIIDAEERLTQAVGTRVRIMPGRAKHSGRIVVEYYNLDDFDRIAGNLGVASVD